MQHSKNGSCQQNISWQVGIQMSSYVKEEWEHLNHTQEIDPSHAGGKWWLVNPMAKAAVAAGCDGLMIEVHNNPEKALCDGPQSLKPAKFEQLMKELKPIADAVGKEI